jgi:Flp pilus assembly protein TadD
MILLIRLGTLLIIAASWFTTTLGETKLGLVSRRNQVRKQAAAAYAAGRYQEALTHYRFLLQSNATPSFGELVNLGHVYFQLGQYASAKREYEKGGTGATPQLMAIAATQLGLLACLKKDTTTALLEFRHALLNDPDNSTARQNFELLKIRFSGKQPLKKVAPPRPTPQPETMQGQRVEKTDQQQDRLTRFKNTTLSDEQARQVLNALQADDLPYALARRRANRKASGKSAGRW